jgi:hypothetical protein
MSKLIIFHGTSAENARKILKEDTMIIMGIGLKEDPDIRILSIMKQSINF